MFIYRGFNYSNGQFFIPQALGYVNLTEERLNELGFSVEAGRLPENINEIALTDYHVAFLNTTGGRDNLSDLTIGNVTAKNVVGHKLMLGNYGSYCTITGIINTGANVADPSSEFYPLSQTTDYYSNNNINLYNKYKYEIQCNYPNCIYVSKEFIDERLADTEIINLRSLENQPSNSNFSLYKGENKEFVTENYIESVTDLKTYINNVVMFDSNKTQLENDEMIISFDNLQQFFDTNDITLDTNDKIVYSYNLEYSYGENGEVTEYKVVTNSYEDINFNSNVYNQNKEIFNYSLDNLPTTDIFNQYVKEYYRYQDNSTGQFEEYKGEITNKLQAYAYYQVINNNFPRRDEFNPQYSDEIYDFFEQYEQTVYYDGETNAFGGKSNSSFYNEKYIRYIKKYLNTPSEPFYNRGSFSTDYEADPVDYKIVGYYISFDYEGSSNLVIISDELYSTFEKDALYPYPYLLVDIKDDNTLKKMLNESFSTNLQTRVFLNNAPWQSISSYNSMLQMLANVLIYVALGLAVFSALLLANFITISISNKKKEIGILRAVGARSSDVFKIFFSEAFVIALINFILATIAAGVAVFLFNNELVQTLGVVGSFFIFGPLQILMMLGISILVSIVATFLPVFFVARKKPVEVIRNN